METWLLIKLPDGTYALYAPDNTCVFVVSLDTLVMLGQMFLDEGEDVNAEEFIDELP